jgi:Protein of unknown function (DUF3467)
VPSAESGIAIAIADLPENTKLVYANWVRMNATPFDLAIDLGYHDEPGPPDAFPVRVAMSWEHAKVLADLLAQNIKAYEDQVGEVRIFDEDGDAHGGD